MLHETTPPVPVLYPELSCDLRADEPPRYPELTPADNILLALQLDDLHHQQSAPAGCSATLLSVPAWENLACRYCSQFEIESKRSPESAVPPHVTRGVRSAACA